MLLEGYGRHGELCEHWQLVRPQSPSLVGVRLAACSEKI
jgi:hypothetical protein